MSQAPLKPPTAAPQKVTNPLALRDALRQASTDPEFARRLIEDPESLKEEYRLADDTIAEIKRVAGARRAAFSKGEPETGELADHALEAVNGGIAVDAGGGGGYES